MSRPARAAVALGLAVLSGALLWSGFPPLSFGLGPVVGVGLFTGLAWGSGGRRAAGLGALMGAVFGLLLLEWMRVIGIDAWLLLVALGSAWLALVGWGTAMVTRLPLAPVWVACVWVLGEALRGRVPLGGFPWGNLSYAQADTAIGDWARYLGGPGTTFLVALAGAGLAAVFRAAGERAGPRGSGTGRMVGWAAVVLGVVILPVLLPRPGAGDLVGGPASTTVAIVQGGTPQLGMGALDVRRAVLDNHVRQTLDLAAAVDAGRVARPAFVLWPENSSDIDPFADPEAAAAITAAARAVGAPILVGAVTQADASGAQGADGVWNVGVVWDPQSGPSQIYIKTHPVPFGEYIPFRSALAGLTGRFDRIPRDFLPGDRPGNLTIAGTEVGDVICFEIAYQEVVDAVVDAGARVITVQTNNATYGGTSQPAQQLQIERMRAGEFGRTVLVAATSGISAVIEPDRTVTDSLGVGSQGWLVVDVPLRGTLTLASRIGHALELLMCLAATTAIVVAVLIPVMRRRRRTRPPSRLVE